jgi:hypothetical protein
MRESSGISVRPTTKLSMLYPRPANRFATPASTPCSFCTRAPMTWRPGVYGVMPALGERRDAAEREYARARATPSMHDRGGKPTVVSETACVPHCADRVHQAVAWRRQPSIQPCSCWPQQPLNSPHRPLSPLPNSAGNLGRGQSCIRESYMVRTRCCTI